MTENQSRVTIEAQNVKPFSIFDAVASGSFCIYSGWFLSNQIQLSRIALKDAVSFLVLTAGVLGFGLLTAAALKKYTAIQVVNWRKRIIRGLFVLILAMHIHTSLIENYTVNGSSMEPVLKDGSTLWAQKISAGIPLPDLSYPFGKPGKTQLLEVHGIRRGDLVVFRYPGLSEKNDAWVKRAAGLPGDAFEFRVDGFYINGAKLIPLQGSSADFYTKEYMQPVINPPNELLLMDPMVLQSAMSGCGRSGIVPDKTLLVLGDNRRYSRDSRAFGFVAFAFIEGVALNPHLDLQTE